MFKAKSFLTVYATAPKYAVGSSDTKALLELPPNVGGFGLNPDLWEFGEPVEANVALPSEQRLRGRITDSDGTPIAKVRLALQSIKAIPDSCTYTNEKDFIKSGSGSTSISHIEQLAQLCTALTDENGAFELRHTAANSRLRITIEAPGYPKLKAFALTTPWNPIQFEPEILVVRSTETLKLPPLVETQVAVVQNDTKEPAGEVCVIVRNPQLSAQGITSVNGRVTLRVPPGTYSLAAYANTGEPYLHSASTVIVPKGGETTVLTLDRGVPVYLQFVRKDIGGGVRRLFATVDGKQYTHVTHSNGQVEVSRGLTTGNGNVRLLLRPGTHRIDANEGSDYSVRRTTVDVQIGKLQRIKIPVSYRQR